MITVLAEKPSVAMDIAKHLGAKSTPNKYYQSKTHYVTWAFGHLIALDKFEKHGFSGEWNIDHLPVLPQEYVLSPSGDKTAKAQLKVIADLFSKSSSIVVATDAGREGELIFRYIYDYLKCDKPFKRLWVSSLTPEALATGFRNLKDGRLYDPLYWAAKARNQADYVVGINGTIGLTSKARGAGVLSIGRVQTPTLALIAQRYLDNINFKPEPYWVVRMNMEAKGMEFYSDYAEKFTTENFANEFLRSLNNGAIVSEVEKNKKSDNPPVLFDLTQLQRHANTQHGFSAQKTLSIAQSLYEKHKAITYPRTSSQYLSVDMKEQVNQAANSTKHFIKAEKVVNHVLQGKSRGVYNDTKVTDHHAIIPTNKAPQLDKLSVDEKAIYLDVVYRFFEALGPAAIKNVTKYKLMNNGNGFNLSGSIMLSPGWRAVQNKMPEDKILPELLEGDSVKVTGLELLDKMTTPPSLLTESALLQLMETAGKLIEEDQLSEAIKECGIGTPATRASIIEVLFKRGYVGRKGKSLIPTQAGLELYDKLKDMPISKPDMTGLWEQKLNKMAEGGYDPAQFQKEIGEYTKELIGEIKTLEINIVKDHIGTCPACKKGKLEHNKVGYTCSEYKNGCKFGLFKKVSDKAIPKAQLEKLITKGKTGLIKGFTTKDKSKKFDAHLVLDPATLKLSFEFPKAEDLSLGKCPKCSSDVRKGKKNYYCTGYKDGCDFGVFAKIAGRSISATVVTKLLTAGKTEKLKGFKSSKSNKEFSAKLVLDENGKVKFDF